MDVFELRLKVYLLNNIAEKEALGEIANLIDTCLLRTKEYENYHNENVYKLYTYNSFYPLEADKVYKAGKIYTIIIRTIDKFLYDYFKKNLIEERTKDIKALESVSHMLTDRHIEKIYSVTPIILKTDEGYWRKILTLKEYENRVRINLVKKYNHFTGDKLDESSPVFNVISFNNKIPIGCAYKNINLLGDKVDLVIANNKIAQELAKIAIGTGVGEINARGYGFVNYRYL